MDNKEFIRLEQVGSRRQTELANRFQIVHTFIAEEHSAHRLLTLTLSPNFSKSLSPFNNAFVTYKKT